MKILNNNSGFVYNSFFSIFEEASQNYKFFINLFLPDELNLKKNERKMETKKL
jgi:hypothetical protein